MNDAPIPPDIRKAAEAVVERGYDEGLIDAVEKAIMAERERCAKIADEAQEMRERLFNENGASINASKAAQAEAIASDIRKGSS